jgi:hypothetical protein
MNYLIYNEQGEIVQSNKVYGDSGEYSETLRERGNQFVMVDTPGPLALHDWWINKGRLTARKPMPHRLVKRVFRADGEDAGIIRSLPRPCRVTVQMTGGAMLADNEFITTGFIEIPCPTPAMFYVRIDAWPYKPLEVILEAQ